MSLAPGSRFGAYEILSVIGEGGMGRVYRARDSRLHREVAVKVLPENVANDPERIARFEREARTLAALNHPHIAQIYAVESGAIVMELVDGEDLAQRIARGPVPWREALPIARQIADALEAAHEQGIIHRDLKPANIRITNDGVVKVLDFGLARAIDRLEGDGFSRRQADAEASALQTVTSPAGVTQAGMILGTAAYMSPEQAKGRAADKRSDVWSFGCVLYDMLTAKRAFPGDDVMETLSAVIRADPDLKAIPSDVPSSARVLIEQCLIKDRRERIADIAAARYALRLHDESHSPAANASSRAAWTVATIAIVAAIAAALIAWPRVASRSGSAPVIRSLIAAPNAGAIGFPTIAISAAGTHIVYSGSDGRLYVRQLNEPAPRVLQGGEGGVNPFFSPDGESVGFFADNKLKRVALAGGAAQTIVDVGEIGRGATWSRDGTIVFTPNSTSGLLRVSAGGGAATPLTTLKPTERSHRWPHFLPDGRTLLFTIQPAGKNFDEAMIASIPIDGGEPQIVMPGGSGAQFAKSGHLIYGKGGTLLAIAFDAANLRTTGQPIAVMANVRSNLQNGAVSFAVSDTGLLVYLPGESTSGAMSLQLATRSGKTEMLFDRRLIGRFQLSPDGQRVAVSIIDGQEDIWLLELKQKSLTRFTFGAGTESFPLWSPDGRRLYYQSNSSGQTRGVMKSIDGGEEQWTGGAAADQTFLFPTSISPDGQTFVGRGIRSGSYDVLVRPLSGSQATIVAGSAANELEAAISPDGRFIAYQSDESGRTEIYVQAYPSGGRFQVSTAGGTQPHWALGGRELVYRNGPSLVAVPITLQPFSRGAAQPLFGIPNLFAFDVTADGQRFVVAVDEENRQDVHFVLISGWFEELQAKMRPAR